MNFTTAIAYIDLVAAGVFAISGALAAAEKRLDILGFVFFGTVTGVGGGTLRDLLLDVPAFWISDTRYLWVCVLLSALSWYLAPMLTARRRILLWADALGLSLFCVLGCAKALQSGAPEVVAVVMGVLSASFGGLLRDTLLGRGSVMLSQEIYVTAALIGSSSYALLMHFAVLDASVCLVLAMVPALVLRAGAMLRGWCLPGYRRL